MPFSGGSQIQSLNGVLSHWAQLLIWNEVVPARSSPVSSQSSWEPGRTGSACWSLSPGSSHAPEGQMCFVLLLPPPVIKLIPAFFLFSVSCCLFHLLKPHLAFKANFKFPRSILWQPQPARVPHSQIYFSVAGRAKPARVLNQVRGHSWDRQWMQVLRCRLEFNLHWNPDCASQ